MTMTQRVSDHFFKLLNFFKNMFNLQSCEMVVCQERRRKLTSDAQKAVTAALREAGGWVVKPHIIGKSEPVPMAATIRLRQPSKMDPMWRCSMVTCLPVAVGRISHPLKGTFLGCWIVQYFQGLYKNRMNTLFTWTSMSEYHTWVYITQYISKIGSNDASYSSSLAVIFC